MYARHFVNNPSSPQLTAWKKWHDHMNQHLMHLTIARVTNRRPWTGADNASILKGFQKTWREFYAEITPGLKPIFDAELRQMREQMPDVPL
jgi:hypothetical protein